MCLLRQRMLLFMGMLLVVLIPCIRTGNQTYSNSECAFGDIESRLSIASEIIETAKQKLPKDLRELCKNFSSNDCDTFDRNDTKICDCNETKIMECNETEIIECNETKIMECNETKIMECNDTKILDCNVTQIFECNETKNFDCEECENKTYYVKPLDCSDIYLSGEHSDGLYYVWPQNRVSTGRLKVYCDMESNGGGWTVLQRRGDYPNNTKYFDREWDAYKRGFGDMLKEFWIGNDNMFVLTSQRRYQLRVNLTARDGDVAYATYDEFWIEDESANYTLHVKGYNGTAGDSLEYHDGQQFTTTDRDNDRYLDGNCANLFPGGWWFNECMFSHLNGLYGIEGGLNWYHFKGFGNSVKDTAMKIRPVAFPSI